MNTETKREKDRKRGRERKRETQRSRATGVHMAEKEYMQDV